MEFKHTSVLLNETIDSMMVRSDGIYLDGTLGGAGHSSHIASKLTTGHLYGTDQDGDAIEAATKRLEPYKDKVSIIRSNYRNAVGILREMGITGVDGILLDLGVSSWQFDNGDRGFSYNTDAPLDMRMDRTCGPTAADLVNSEGADGLEETFRDPRIRMRELDAEGRSADYVFLPGEPISRNGRFFEFELDRDNSIFIPVGDALVAENQAKYGPSEKHGAVLFKSSTYTTVQRKTRSFQKLSGKKAVLWVTKGMLQKTGQEINRAAQSLDAPRRKTPSKSPDIPKETAPKAAAPKPAPKKTL